MSAADTPVATLRARAAGDAGGAGATRTVADYRACAEAGMTMREAATRLGVTYDGVRKQARKHGLAFRGEKAPVSEESISTAIQMHEAGAPFSVIARKIGCHLSTVSRILVGRGVAAPAPPVEVRPTEDYRACAEAGMTMREAAAHLGVSLKSVQKRSARHGIKFRPLREPKPATKRRKTVEDYRACAEAGMSVREAAAHLGVSADTVRDYKTKHALPFRLERVSRKMGEDDIRVARLLHEGGLSYAKIAKQVGFDRETISRALGGAKPAPVLAEAAPDLEDDDAPDEPFIAPCPRQVASLMALGHSRREAIRQSVLYRKAQARKAESAPTLPAVVRRAAQGPYRLGQSLHATQHGVQPCQRLGEIPTETFGETR